MIQSRNYNHCTLSYEWTDGGVDSPINANCLVLPNYEQVYTYNCNPRITVDLMDNLVILMSTK